MDEPIRYRPRLRQLPWWLPVLPFLSAAAAPGPTFTAERLTATTAVAAVMLTWQSTMGVELRPDALVMRGLRRRTIPWRDISWIEPAPMLGTHMVGIRVRDRLMRPRAPVHTRFLGSDPEFEAKARTIFDYWVEHRGPDWRPPAPPGVWWAGPEAGHSGT